MKRILFCTAIAAVALTSCSSDDFLGEVPGNNPSAVTAKEISFSGEAGKTSRATRAGEDKTKDDAATALSNNFIVFGTKNVNGTNTIVYDHYNVNYTDNNWVYAGVKSNSLNNTKGNQALKFWDYSASQYDFVAFSLGGKEIGEGSGKIKVERITNNNKPTYTLSGKISDLQGCFIADKMSVTSTDYGKAVQFTFRSTGTKVGVSIYETIPGYSIKEIKFYLKDASTATSNTPILYASTDCIPVNDATGSLTVKFNNVGAAEATLTHDANTETTSKTSSITFDQFALNMPAEDKETTNNDDKYIGRTSNDATSTNEIAVTTCKVTGGLSMKADYTLIATDGSGETITVTGASVNVPEVYTDWKPNFIYNYIFKITEKTNGSTGGTGGIAGLKPIVFDAIVTENEDGSQITETTFKDDGTSETTVIRK
jgi:hypothetical protein